MGCLSLGASTDSSAQPAPAVPCPLLPSKHWIIAPPYSPMILPPTQVTQEPS
jgi:hypothetical protein